MAKRLAVILAAVATLLMTQGCQQTDIRGTYEIEIELFRSAGPINGTLILSTSALDVPAIGVEDQESIGEWLESDSIDANSCFVLGGGTGAEATPQNVRVFDARIAGNHVTLPLEIYRTPQQHLEIVKLQFFANTIGGDVILHDRGQQMTGRFHGIRLRGANPEKCVEDLEAFRETLRSSLAP